MAIKYIFQIVLDFKYSLFKNRQAVFPKMYGKYKTHMVFSQKIMPWVTIMYLSRDSSGFGSEFFYVNNIFLGLLWKLTSKFCDFIMFITCFIFLWSWRQKQHLSKRKISKSGLLHPGKLHQNNRPCRLGILREICALKLFGSHDFYCLSAADQWTDNLKE